MAQYTVQILSDGCLVYSYVLPHSFNIGDTLRMTFDGCDFIRGRDTRFKSKRAGMVPLTEAELDAIVAAGA